MNKENKSLSRKDFLHISGAGYVGLQYLKNKILLDGLFPGQNSSIENKPDYWPALDINKLPTEISSILRATPEMKIDNTGHMSLKKSDDTWTEIIRTPTQFNIENSRQIDKLRTGFPWAIVLHWVGGEYETLDRYIEGGFNSLRSYNGNGKYRTSAHFLVGEKSPLTSESGWDKPLSIAQIQEPDTDGVPFRAAHLAPVDWEGYLKNNRRWYPVNAMYELQYKSYPKFHSVLQDIYDGLHISVDKRTLGIEIAGADFDNTPPAKQTTANVLATVWTLMKAYKVSAWDVIGHWEIQSGKSDPGKEYISSIRFLLGLKALQDPDPEMKKLVYGNFIEGNNYNKAAKDYFDSIRNYLILISRPDVVSRWEAKTKFWSIYDSLFSKENDMPVAHSLRNPVDKKDTILSYKFLDSRRGNGFYPGHDYFLKDNKAVPSFLIGDAKCIFAGDLGRNFGNTAIFRLRTPEGSDYLIRYLHLDNLQVKEDVVYSKDKIVGNIGKTGNVVSKRLSFDIAPISTYERIGSDNLEFNYWPSATVSRENIQYQFVDPSLFLSQYPETSTSEVEQREYSR
jgi:hypothetical protein